MKAKKLIEVAMPIKEISAESVRDKSIRHGHISTLHLWWARRPLPACRAVVFGSLVPDPLDENCPQAFRDAIEDILMHLPQYRPYKDIPYTAAYDPMPDNQRNRLMMFIGRFSNKCQRNMLQGASTPPAEQLDNGSLIKWENKNNQEIIDRAQKLIWVAYNAENNPSADYSTLSSDFETAKSRIRKCEEALYGILNHHIRTSRVSEAESALQDAITAFQTKMPKVFDPFAGGGAIPLEATRLGCRSYGNDINPVAHIIEKGSAEFPQKYGKPISFTKDAFLSLYGADGFNVLKDRPSSLLNETIIQIPNRLAFDVEYYSLLLLKRTENVIGHLYPKNGEEVTSAYYWARTVKCSNPSCQAEVPMLKQFYLANTKQKRIYLNPIINGTSISFEIKNGNADHLTPFLKGKECSLECPCCGSITSGKIVKEQSKLHNTGERLLAVIRESSRGKIYSLPSKEEFEVCSIKFDSLDKPTGLLPQNDSQNLKIPGWGYESWSSMFTDRQLNMILEFINQFKVLEQQLDDTPYNTAVLSYLAMWIDRIIAANTSFGRIDSAREGIQTPFSRQAIPMMFDFPESNPFCNSSGCAMNQLEWILRYIEGESSLEFPAFFANSSSGEKNQFNAKTLTAVVTDPPYYDAIAYADLSDFFYVWMKRTLAEKYPINFSTPQTPKTDECTAIKYRFGGNENLAKKHFEDKLTQIFVAIEYQTSDIVSIMFAHQSTEAWTTLCNSILGAKMNIAGSWPIDTEMANRSLGLAGAALESSVTVACRPSERNGFGDFKDIKRAITQTVEEEVELLYSLGFRGPDLLTACFGKAVREFGKYKFVEKADGSIVNVADLLELASKAALDTLVKGVPGDDFTRFYIGWLQMNGMGDTDFDDATKFTRVGMSVDVSEIFARHLLIREGKKQHLATAEEHLGHSSTQGIHPEDSLIDQVHRTILAYDKGDRQLLLTILHNVGADDQSAPFWRLAASLKELLPEGKDLKAVEGLLGNSDDLRQESREVDQHQPEQMTFDFGSDFNSDFK